MKKITHVLTAVIASSMLLCGCGPTQQQQEPVKFTVTYNMNGAASGTCPIDATSYSENDTATVLANTTLAKPDYDFVSWNTKADGSGTSYNAGDTFIIIADTTLYAQWDGYWYIDIKDVLAADGATGPIESIGRWLDEEEAEVEWDVVDDNGPVVTLNAYKTVNEEKTCSSLLDGLITEFTESKNWAILGFNDSNIDFGELYGYGYAKPNSKTNKYTVMEFSFVSETSFSHIIFGEESGLTFYFYNEQGYNAEDAMSLLSTGVYELGADKDLIVDGASLEKLGDTFIVDAELSDPYKNLFDSISETYTNEGVDYEIQDSDIFALGLPVESFDEAKAGAEMLLSMVNFSINGSWADASEAVGATAYMAAFKKGNDFTANAIVVEDIFEYVAVVEVTCINTDLIEILSYSISCFSYDMTIDGIAEFASLINTNNYVVMSDYVGTFGGIAYAKDTIGESNQVIGVNYSDNGAGSFVISVAPTDAPMTTYPVDLIESIYTSAFTTNVPTFEFDFALVVDYTDDTSSPTVGVVAMDPVAEPTDENPALVDIVLAEMEKKSTEWDCASTEFAGITYYVFTSKEENASGELMQITITEIEYCVVIQYSVVIAPKNWSEITSIISDFITGEGFESTTLPAANNGKVWGTSLIDDGWDYELVLYCIDEEETFVDTYKATLLADTTHWMQGTDEWGDTIIRSVETTTSNKFVNISFATSEGMSYIYISFGEAPVALPVAQVNEILSNFGLTNFFDSTTETYLMMNGDFECELYYENEEEPLGDVVGCFIYAYIVKSENSFEHLKALCDALELEVDDSAADYGYYYYEGVIGDYYFYIMISDFMDGFTSEISISISLVEEE